MMMKKPLFFATATTLALATTQVQAADASAGEEMYAQNCAQCHGGEGKGMASFPALTGRDAGYITSRLETYRAGEKVGSNSGLMIPNASNLSDDDIANLAAYISENFQ